MQTELKGVLGDVDVTVTFSLNREKSKAQGICKFDYNTCVASVKTLLANGCRLIDTAYNTPQEEKDGQGIQPLFFPQQVNIHAYQDFRTLWGGQEERMDRETPSGEYCGILQQFAGVPQR